MIIHELRDGKNPDVTSARLFCLLRVTSNVSFFFTSFRLLVWQQWSQPWGLTLTTLMSMSVTLRQGKALLLSLKQNCQLPPYSNALFGVQKIHCFHYFVVCRAFAVVASALGIPSLLPFLKAVCRSKKSWQARHTGIKIVQQIAILMGCAILPHLRNLVEIIEHGKITNLNWWKRHTCSYGSLFVII